MIIASKKQKTVTSNNLPDTIAYIITNSIEQRKKGVTNISNTFNIYST